MNTFDQPENEDLRVIDYLKQKFTLSRKPSSISVVDDEEKGQILNDLDSGDEGGKVIQPIDNKFGALFIPGLLLIIIAQGILSFKLSASPVLGGVIMLIGMVSFYFSLNFSPSEKLSIQNEKTILKNPKLNTPWLLFLSVLILGFLGLMLFRNNGLGWLQVGIWFASIGVFVFSFWERGKKVEAVKDVKSFSFKWASLIEKIKADKVFYLTVAAVVFIVLLSHILVISRLPIEMVSAQVETYLAVEDIRSGSQAILFSNNVVSEPLGYYWLALVSLFFGPSLRLLAFYLAFLVSFAVGCVFLFKLGTLMFNRWVGIMAVLMAGISFWTIIQNYALIGGGLVFPILCAALFFLFRGLQQSRHEDFIFCGLVSGLGLLSHKLFLLMPLVAILLVFIWWSQHKNRKTLAIGLTWMGLFLFTLVLVSLPLLGAISLNPSTYFHPILSRLTSLEVSLQGNPLSLFLKNFGTALGILNWSNRTSWVDGIANRPALDIISAVLFIAGLVALVKRTAVEKTPQFISLLVLLPVLLLPSVMSLAFPMENPSLSRAYVLAIPTFIVVSYGGVFLFENMKIIPQKMRLFLFGLVLLLILGSQYQLIHWVYPENFRQNAWNAKEMSESILKFKDTYGQDAQAWVVGHPHWVDERAVAIMANIPVESLKLDMTSMESLEKTSGTKLFILNVDAQEAISQLKTHFPNGVESLFQSQQAGKNFMTFLVPEN